MVLSHVVVTTRKSGVNAENLKELLDFGSYGKAWCRMQKLRRYTIRQDREKLCGRVEVDDLLIGGQKSGIRGRGAEGKTIVIESGSMIATDSWRSNNIIDNNQRVSMKKQNKTQAKKPKESFEKLDRSSIIAFG